jgi:serine/threonine-protein kinase PknK
MAELDPPDTRGNPAPPIAAELAAAGFDDAHEVGRGGFGTVYRCRQRSLDRTVAIKVLTCAPDPDNLERFLREQRAMGKLSGHPNIVNVFQVGVTTSGLPYIVMQYHPHDSLAALIRTAGPLRWQDTLHLGVKMAGALETAHRLATLHRDIKPANILLTDYGDPQLTDFGIARIAGGFETTTGVITGSPAFTAPEVLEGQAPTPASDVYSLGATIFCAVTGHAAFERRVGEQVVTQFLRTTDTPHPGAGPNTHSRRRPVRHRACDGDQSCGAARDRRRIRGRAQTSPAPSRPDRRRHGRARTHRRGSCRRRAPDRPVGRW